MSEWTIQPANVASHRYSEITIQDLGSVDPPISDRSMQAPDSDSKIGQAIQSKVGEDTSFWELDGCVKG